MCMLMMVKRNHAVLRNKSNTTDYFWLKSKKLIKNTVIKTTGFKLWKKKKKNSERSEKIQKISSVLISVSNLHLPAADSKQKQGRIRS